MEQRYREHAHAQAMFEKVERFLASTLSQAEFCQQEGLAYWTFRYWLKKYRLRSTVPPQTRTSTVTANDETPSDFIPLRLLPTEPAAPSSTCVIEYPSGILVRFHGPVDGAVLAQLLHTQPA
jgi:hypothetical protein